MKAAAIAASLVVFGILYVTAVQPKREAAASSEQRLLEVRAQLASMEQRAPSGHGSTRATRSHSKHSSSAARRMPRLTDVVTTPGRSFAILDDRIVRPGDGTAYGVVGSIESDAVLIISPEGETRRVDISRPHPRSGR